MTIVEAIRKLAEEYPGATYVPPEDPNGNRTCYYSKGRVIGGPGEGCIVGQAIKMLEPGVALQELDDIALIDILDLRGVGRSDRDWVAQVQRQQDVGETWSRAVDLADSV